MKMGKKCNCDCMNCKPLTVYNGNDWNVYRYGTCKNRVTGMCQLKSKGVQGEYHYTCEILKRGVNNGN